MRFVHGLHACMDDRGLQSLFLVHCLRETKCFLASLVSLGSVSTHMIHPDTLNARSSLSSHLFVASWPFCPCSHSCPSLCMPWSPCLYALARSFCVRVALLPSCLDRDLSASMSLLAVSLVLCLCFCTVRVCLSSSLHDASISLSIPVSHRLAPSPVFLSVTPSFLFVPCLATCLSVSSIECVRAQCVSSPLPAPPAILLSSRPHLGHLLPPLPLPFSPLTHCNHRSLSLLSSHKQLLSSAPLPAAPPASSHVHEPDHTAAIIVGEWGMEKQGSGR
jgi:hypothetical protein